ncbi:MAG TPA: hypothetical protein VFN54_01745 [Acidimicrobiales bacterium]|nr:hypothetical protein [Acidimicrobiales bacterium]
MLADLNLDQIIVGVCEGWEGADAIAQLLRDPPRDLDVIELRQHVFRDLEDPTLQLQIRHVLVQLRDVHTHLSQLDKMRSAPQRDAWFLDATSLYLDAVNKLADSLNDTPLRSSGLLSLRDVLAAYRSDSVFESFTADMNGIRQALDNIEYSVRIDGLHVEVSRYNGEPDYSDAVLATFDRFKQGAAKDYRVAYRFWPSMNHVGERILELVAQLFPDTFSTLADFRVRHTEFFAPALRRFEQEIQFFLAYLDFLAPLRRTGLSVCYPQVTSTKEIHVTSTFDLALATKLLSREDRIVTNDLTLRDGERIIVISGPNQGGKTTFARTFGQLHHLARTGCPVPGSRARLFFYDRIYTHFEREEDLERLSGKLEDDLTRIKLTLLAANSDSVIILNEIFSSTTLHDAQFLGRKVMDKLVELDVLGVYVTFVVELASVAPSVVSMVSTINPDQPDQRTFNIIRAPADGLAFALAIADKHGLTYERLKARLIR